MTPPDRQSFTARPARVALRGVTLGPWGGLGLRAPATMIGLAATISVGAGRVGALNDARTVIALVTGFGSGTSARIATVPRQRCSLKFLGA